MIKTLFLPGAAGNAEFWRPVADGAGLDGFFLSWPGLGSEPRDACINSVDDLVNNAALHITQPVNIIAQSMGGVVAIKLALKFPELVRRLVLTATSGGVAIADLGGADWQEDYFTTFPNAARWIADPVPDLSEAIQTLTASTLLLWGDADPISPVAVGRRLASLVRNSRLHILEGAAHDLARTHPGPAAQAITHHLAADDQAYAPDLDLDERS